jgi:KH domain-containing protein
MEEIYVKRISQVINNKDELEKKLKVKISIKGKKVIFDGDSVDEFDAENVFSAINFGFSAKRALLLRSEDILFRKVHIKDHTKRNDMKAVRARLIGTHGKTRMTIEEIAGCDIVVTDSDVGIIGDAESIDEAVIAIVNLIKGSKQSNAYFFLERMNAEKKKPYSLGIKKN